MSQIEISVILPVYNAQGFLKEAVESILNQTYSAFELIIIDDGSTDNSGTIIRSFNDPRIVNINNPENIGLIKSLNKGILAARGKYIARMDADDISLPKRFEMQLKAFESNEKLVAVSTDYFLREGTRETLIENIHRSDELKTTLLFSPCFAHPTVMMKNVFAENKLFYDEKYIHTEDYKLWMDLSFIGEFYNVSQPLLKYRSHPKQVSNIYNQKQKEMSGQLRKWFLEKSGFTFTGKNLESHNVVGNNVFIRSAEQLKDIEKWFIELIRQNQSLKTFTQKEFESVIHKFWYDSCGNTSLGLTAYHLYFKSGIRNNRKIAFSNRIKLLAKCIIRRFRK